MVGIVIYIAASKRVDSDANQLMPAGVGFVGQQGLSLVTNNKKRDRSI
jgi:hypothetical protein